MAMQKIIGFSQELDSISTQFIDTLNRFEESQILQNYFFSLLESIAYAIVIDNFFSNLTDENVSELKYMEIKLTLLKKNTNHFKMK